MHVGTGNRVFATALVAILSLLAGCGGGGGDDGDDEEFDNDATGVWTGTHTPDGKPAVSVTAVVAPNGRFVAVSSQIYLSGSGTVSGDRLSASATGWAPAGATFANGSTSGAFTLTGFLFEENRSESTYSGANESGRLVLNYSSSRSNRSSSLATIAGSYATGSGATSVAINSNGAITFNSTQGTNCIGNGTMRVGDSTRNVYTWSMTLSGCTAVNGSVDGVATLDDVGGQANNQLVMLGASSSAPFGVIAVK
jgi:hypothetical protein